MRVRCAGRAQFCALDQDLALSALRFKFAPYGWRVFASDTGRWWATTTSSSRSDYRGRWHTGLADAVDADTPAELAAKLRKRLGQ